MCGFDFFFKTFIGDTWSFPRPKASEADHKKVNVLCFRISSEYCAILGKGVCECVCADDTWKSKAEDVFAQPEQHLGLTLTTD